MANFRVSAANGEIARYEGDYKVTEGGVLAVAPDEGNPIIYSPSGWLSLEVQDAQARLNVVGDLLEAE